LNPRRLSYTHIYRSFTSPYKQTLLPSLGRYLSFICAVYST